MKRKQDFRIALAIALALTAGSACGGSAPPARATAERGHEEDEASHESEPEEAAPEPGPRPRCDDGSCFACGAGYCPLGFYCDEGAPGGPLCSWIPACPASACDCLGRALGSCRCETREGGAHVSCG